MFSELKSPADLENEVLAFWKEKDIFARCLEASRGKPEFVFYEGPPTANGTPHNGHVLTRAIKDLFPRYKTMRGYHVARKGGWDTHGLPVEVEVEKTLGIHGKEAIREYGLEAFNRKCVDSVFTYTREWEELTERIGFWVNLDEAYVTYHRKYVESVWWALSELFSKGLLYKGHKVLWWWPQGGTALSSGEVGMGYKTVDDPSVTVRFRLKSAPDTYLLAWTTTPWTLPSNTAICVHPDTDYAFVQGDGEILVVADALKEQVEGEVLKIVKGRELVGEDYEPLFPFGRPETGEAWRVIPGDHVTLSQGTGLVHTAPAYGEDDYRIAAEQGIGMLQWVGPDGRFVAGTDFVEGMMFKEADAPIIRNLKERGLLFSRETVRHDYPFCWRSDDDPLIQFARPGWFIRTTAFKDEALANNEAVSWLPDHIREGRFGDFLRNNVDWALSRERFWGTPLNIWTCDSCDNQVVPASVAEIEAMAPGSISQEVSQDLAVHRPWIDDVILPCEACGGKMHRVPEVIDCWFDSGCMPFAQWGFPHQGHEEFARSFPADFISEAVDQTRGWFYSLLMISTLIFDEACCEKLGLENAGLPRPYRNCIVLGHVCDMDGRKESKSKGNYTPPDLVIQGKMRLSVQEDSSLQKGEMGLKRELVRALNLGEKECLQAVGAQGEKVALKVVVADVNGKETAHLHPEVLAALDVSDRVTFEAPFAALGADAFRWLFYASNPPWSNTRLSLRAIREGQREFLMRLGNVHSFFCIYANIAGFDPADTGARPVAERHVLDRWILQEFDALVHRATSAMDDYQLYEAARDIQTFVDGLSNWYVRRSRRRFWGEGQDSRDALDTLYRILCRFSRLIAPFVPFTAEALYQSLEVGQKGERPVSVHLCSWPESEGGEADQPLAEGMALIRELANLGLSARSRVGVKVRQPLLAAEVILAQPERSEGLDALLPLLQEELNVREIRFAARAEDFVDFRVKPDYRALGKRLGKDMKACASQLNALPGSEVRSRVLSGGLEMTLPSGKVTLGPEDIVVEVCAKESFQAAGSALAVVVLHAELDEDLRREGLAREVVNRIQGQRKELELGYSDRIHLSLGGDEEILDAVTAHQEYVAGETLAISVERVEGDRDGGVALAVEGKDLLLWVRPA